MFCGYSHQGIELTLRREDPENGGPAALVAPGAASSCLFNSNGDHVSEWYPHTTDGLTAKIMEYT